LIAAANVAGNVPASALIPFLHFVTQPPAMSIGEGTIPIPCAMHNRLGKTTGGAMNRVVHFELGAVDPARAVDFYQNVFGWEAQKWGAEEYWLMKTGSSPEPGIDGSILRNKDSQPRTVNSIQVSSIQEYAGKVEQHGGQVVVPKMTIPTVGYVAYCKDTEGKIFGIYQPDHSAQ